MPELTREVAKTIAGALRSGTVPDVGLEHYAVGLELELKALKDQMEEVSTGKSAFKCVRGDYGAGKTFLCSLAAAEALDRDFVATKVVISSETPLYKTEEVYRKICQGMTLGGGRTGSMQGILDRWLFTLEEQVVEVDGIDEESPHFSQAVERKVDQFLADVADRSGRFASCIKAYHRLQYAHSFQEAQGILDWMAGERKVTANIKKLAGVKGDLERSDVFSFLKGLLEVLRQTRHRGLFVVFDEVETVTHAPSNIRGEGLRALRQWIDAIAHNEFPGLHLLVTGTPDFFEGEKGVPSVEALHQRIKVDFPKDGRDNFRQPQIRLRSFDVERLSLVAKKVRDIFPADHPERVRAKVDQSFVDQLVDHMTQAFGGRVSVTPRLFLRELVDVIDRVDQYDDWDPHEAYQFNPKEMGGVGLRPEEEELLGKEIMI